MKLENKIREAVITLVVVVLIGAFIKDYFSQPVPVFYSEDTCPYSIFKCQEISFPINVENRGESFGFTKLCVSSQEFIFKSDTTDFSNKLCYAETELNPKQTGLHATFKSMVKQYDNISESVQNATITVQIPCSQRIWSLISKKCGDVIYSCDYYRQGIAFMKKIQ